MPITDFNAILNRGPSGFEMFVAGEQARRDDQQFQQQQAKTLRDQQYSDELGKFLGQDVVNTLLSPEAQADRAARQQLLMQLNPQATMQALGAQQTMQDRAYEAQQQQLKDQSLRIVRSAELAEQSKFPKRYIQESFPEIHAQILKENPEAEAWGDEEWRNAASSLKAEFMPTAGLDPNAGAFTVGNTRYTAQGKPIVTVPPDPLEQQRVDNRKRELDLEEKRLKAGGEGTGLLDADTLDLAAHTIMLDPAQMSQYVSRSVKDAPIRKQINQEIAAKLKTAGMDPGDLAKLRANYQGQKKSIVQLTGQLNAVDTFEKLARFNGDRVLQLIKQLDDTGVPWVEGLTRHIKRGAGDADAAELNSVLVPFQTEVARIVNNPNLTGVLSDSARTEVQHMSDGSMSAKQAERVINRLFLEMDMRKKFINDQLGSAANSLAGKEGQFAIPQPAAAPQPAAGGWTIEAVQ